MKDSFVVSCFTFLSLIREVLCMEEMLQTVIIVFLYMMYISDSGHYAPGYTFYSALARKEGTGRNMREERHEREGSQNLEIVGKYWSGFTHAIEHHNSLNEC